MGFNDVWMVYVLVILYYWCMLTKH
jgi:hypothetical protein